MLRWSINLFRIRGIRISLHFSWVLMLAYICYDGYQEAGIPGLWFNTAVFLAFFTCIVLHELGHSFTGMRLGVNVRRILLMPIGGMAEFERIPRKPSDELLITIAGPAVNFVLAGLIWVVMHLLYGKSVAADNDSIFLLFLETLFAWNIRVGLFNLIPAFPMDGGRIFRALLATRLSYLRATWWAATVAKVLTVGGIVWALFGTPGSNQGILIALFVFIFMAGETEYQAVKRMDELEAFWKEEMFRRMGVVHPSDEPPPLK